MDRNLAQWEISSIRRKMAEYRRAQENYYLEGKPQVILGNGQRVFSLITPPPGSPVARRRVRLIMQGMAQSPGQSLTPTHLGPGLRTPHVITVAVAYGCQCECLHCSAAQIQEEVRRSGDALTYSQLCDAIGQTVDLGTTCVVLTGGEPLLYNRLEDVIRSVDKRRAVCTIFTNGEYLDQPRIQRLKEAGVFGVFVSFDHATAERHDANRQRPGLFEKATKGLQLCRQAGVPTGISTFATREKIETGELDELMDLARRLGVIEVFLFDVIPTGRLSEQRDCLLDQREAGLLRAFREKYNHKADYPSVIHQTMFSSIAYPCVAEGCPAGSVTLHLRANGDVCPCDFTPHSFGNVKRQPLRDIWQTMVHSDLYANPSSRCRLSQPAFWRQLDEFRASS
jgi:MoaA/NifB/PqqE/SkfB family radical SAM enzyme